MSKQSGRLQRLEPSKNNHIANRTRTDEQVTRPDGKQGCYLGLGLEAGRLAQPELLFPLFVNPNTVMTSSFLTRLIC